MKQRIMQRSLALARQRHIFRVHNLRHAETYKARDNLSGAARLHKKETKDLSSGHCDNKKRDMVPRGGQLFEKEHNIKAHCEATDYRPPKEASARVNELGVGPRRVPTTSQNKEMQKDEQLFVKERKKMRTSQRTQHMITDRLSL